MPPKKKGGKGKGKGKGKKGKKEKAPADPNAKSPEQIIKDFVKAYNERCAADNIAPLTSLVRRLKALLDEEVELPPKLTIGEEIGPDGLRALAGALVAASWNELKAIYLWRADVRDEGVVELEKLLRHLPHLEDLELLDCGLSYKSCQPLSIAIESGITVSKLTLDYNTIDNEGLLRLCQGIAMNPQFLTRLSLAYCGLTQDAGEHISRYILKSSKVQDLNVQGNLLEGEGIVKLCDGLRDTETLKKLNIRGNGFGFSPDAIAALCEAITTNKSLEELDMGLNTISTELSEQLATALSTKENLYKLCVPETAGNFKQLMECVKKPKGKGKKGKGKGKGKGGKKKKKK